MSTATNVIEVQGLRKSYGDRQVLRDITVSVRSGEIFGVLGRNGAGKTTTVESIAGLRPVDGGRVRVLGIDPHHDPATIRESVGVQLQESTMPAKLKVIEALRMYAAFYADPADPEDLLDLLGLQEKRDTYFANLSGGQKQRLSIALALIGNPKIAILDELTTGLDPQARRDTWLLIERVRDSGVTILLVTHFMDEAERLCDRLVVIDDGTVVAEGSPRDLTRNQGDQRLLRMALPDGAPTIDLTTVAGVERVSYVGDEVEVLGTAQIIPNVVAALAKQGVIPDEMRTVANNLEDVFVDLIRSDTATAAGTPVTADRE